MVTIQQRISHSGKEGANANVCAKYRGQTKRWGEGPTAAIAHANPQVSDLPGGFYSNDRRLWIHRLPAPMGWDWFFSNPFKGDAFANLTSQQSQNFYGPTK
jgi:hypothetical protein